jgi:hypothetical protein
VHHELHQTTKPRTAPNHELHEMQRICTGKPVLQQKFGSETLTIPSHRHAYLAFARARSDLRGGGTEAAAFRHHGHHGSDRVLGLHHGQHGFAGRAIADDELARSARAPEVVERRALAFAGCVNPFSYNTYKLFYSTQFRAIFYSPQVRGNVVFPQHGMALKS